MFMCSREVYSVAQRAYTAAAMHPHGVSRLTRSGRCQAAAPHRSRPHSPHRYHYPPTHPALDRFHLPPSPLLLDAPLPAPHRTATASPVSLPPPCSRAPSAPAARVGAAAAGGGRAGRGRRGCRRKTSGCRGSDGGRSGATCACGVGWTCQPSATSPGGDGWGRRRRRRRGGGRCEEEGRAEEGVRLEWGRGRGRGLWGGAERGREEWGSGREEGRGGGGGVVGERDGLGERGWERGGEEVG